ncbi:hypothetical protein VTN77DRAFT_6888 [Rasamsonia byssochlamydoides]|uniref:uncharacterized protein n=1 Tax=Rasamsonia byssochlamydoides TaxID=89139 RepID=UPI003742157C
MTRNLIAIRDPLAVQEVFDLIRQSGQVYAHGLERMTAMTEMMTFSTSTKMKTKTKTGVLSLPAEIQWLVLDSLHHIDIRRLLDATGWQIADIYWRCRLQRDLIFELNDLGPDAHLDWQFLCLDAEKMMEESFGLMNRQRICNVLEEVKQRMDFLLSIVETGDPDQKMAESTTPRSDDKEDEEEQLSEWEQPEFWGEKQEQEQAQ